jgi:hypothetical protein
MEVGEHGVEEKVVVSREEVVAMAIAAALPVGCCCFLRDVAANFLALHPQDGEENCGGN